MFDGEFTIIWKSFQNITSTGGTNLKDDIIRLEAEVQIIVGTHGSFHDLNKQYYQKEYVLDEVRFKIRWKYFERLEENKNF